jgi:hypothetical protein
MHFGSYEPLAAPDCMIFMPLQPVWLELSENGNAATYGGRDHGWRHTIETHLLT